MISYIVGLAGVWFLQDALASMAFYPNEDWKWNHIARLIRAGLGIMLIIVGGIR